MVSTGCLTSCQTTLDLGVIVPTQEKKKDLANYEIAEKYPRPRQNQNTPNTNKEPPKRPHERLHPRKLAARRNAPPTLRDQDEGICRQFSYCSCNLVIILPSKIFSATLTSTIL